MSTRRALTAAAAVVVALGLGGCFADAEPDASPTRGTPSAGADPADAPDPQAGGSSAAAVDPDDVPPDDTDYSVDAGDSQPTYTYEPEPEPADTVVATLCNLNQEFFRGLRPEVAGEPVAEDTLRTNLVGLGDLIDEWDSLRIHYPDVVPQIDRAQEIYADWQSALALRDDGDTPASAREMAKAEEAIDALPQTGPAPGGCAS